MFRGQSIEVLKREGDIAELRFDRQDDVINKLDKRTLDEMREATALLSAQSGIKGLLITSGKDAFIVGADITEFGGWFKKSEEEIEGFIASGHAIFNAIEDLPFPTVAAINGFALGGGLETALAADYRVMSSKAQIGLPEVKLGIFPAYGGTVRLSRLIGADNALDWIAGGEQKKAEAALKAHAVDAVVPPERLVEAGLQLLKLADQGAYDWKARRAQKKGPLGLNAVEARMVFESARGLIAQKVSRHMPAPLAAVSVVEAGASKPRDEALVFEAKTFAKIARTGAADALVTLFLSDQFIKKKAKRYSKLSRPVKQAAVLGAGIMGGGIAYQSASRGTPILMKDIAEKSLTLGMSEANKLLAKEVERGRYKPEKAGAVLSSIRPTLHYAEFGNVDVVVEAVVENVKVKKSVLAEVEALVRPDTVIASNTSSISINELAGVLKRPENFLGMHFFNPVHRMPLVEVITGDKSSPEAVATVVGYATAMGKTAIVVKDCPGFLVNRILFPYFFGFLSLVRDGADFARIDKVMEAFGWPMGPAYLLDVVGIDTAHHVGEVLSEGYPDRMKADYRTALDVMYEAQRFGQKNGIGFYKYEIDPKGKPKKSADPQSYELLAAAQPAGTKDFTDSEIIERLMLPMIIETERCLEEGIVESPVEADLGLILGLGFPQHLGGALKYADQLGLAHVVERADAHAAYGKLFEPTQRMRVMAAQGQHYYSA